MIRHFIDLLLAPVIIIYYWFEALILALIPTFLRSKKDLRGKVVVITGSASGLGQALAIKFARLDCKLALWDINEARNTELVDSLSSLSCFDDGIVAYTVDVSNANEVSRKAQEVIRVFGQVDILINNAGVVNGNLLQHTPAEQITRLMGINTLSHFWTIKAFLPGMLEHNSGHIVCIASAAGVVGHNFLTDYCASKFAVVGLMDSLAYELHYLEKDIQTTVVCPTQFDSGMFDGYQIRFPLLTPLLSVEDLAQKTIKAIRLNKKLLYLPKITLLTRLLPVKSCWAFMDCFGVDRAMENFIGHRVN